MVYTKPMKTPIHTFEAFSTNKNGKKVNEMIYRNMIGSVFYLMAKRPNIIHSICLCARF